MAMNGAVNGASSSSSIKVTVRQDQSVVGKIANHLLKPFRPKLALSNAEFPDGSPKLDWPKLIESHCFCKEQLVDNIYQYELTSIAAPTGAEGPFHNLYYFAGGGFQQPPSKYHWKMCAELCRQMPQLRMYLVSYPLVPHNPAEKALPLLDRYLEKILDGARDRKEKITLAGDSAGGNIVLSLGLKAAQRALETGQCALENIVAICPAVDMRNANAAMKAVAEKDVLLTLRSVEEVARNWVGSMSREDPRLSPVLADLTPFAAHNIKVHGITASYDMLSPGALVFRDKLSAANVTGEWLEWHKQMHCFLLAMAPGYRESHEAIQWLVDVLSRNCTVGAHGTLSDDSTS